MFMKINSKEILATPNLISLFRLILAIPFIYCFEMARHDASYFSFIVYLILLAFITDILDGYIARRTNQITELGKLIDPLADKTLVAIIVIYLFLMNKIPLFYFYTIILRDVIIFVGGVYVSKKIGKILPSNLLGKATVFSIGIFFIAILLNAHEGSLIYLGFLYISLALSVLSIFGYTIRAHEFLNKNEHETHSPN